MDRSQTRQCARYGARLYAQHSLRLEFGVVQHRFEPWAFVSQEPLSRLVRIRRRKMKHFHVSMLCLAVALYSGSAFAQHGHMGGSSHDAAASHGSMNSANSGSTHRMTIDQQLSKNTQLSGKIQKLT